MEYTISKLAKLAGISSRTLRYYDEINLLKPSRINSSGYRIYGQKEIDRLQQILFLRELEVDLGTIIQIMNESSFDQFSALLDHQNKLIQKRARLDKLIETIDKTIAHQKGEIVMSNEEKFKAFKESLIAENEVKYGEEIREKYGDKTVDESNAKLRGMSKEDYAAMEKLGNEIFDLLPKAIATGDPTSEIAQELAEKHKEWLTFSWASYSKEAHKGLAEMYVADERFKAYYDKVAKGATEFLRDAIINYVDK
ncbi:MerR family transcriptional regulator [Ureibacillus chungkukjangi]|uniref:DNA-binding transcriptional MerR regulator n=1 Tax=Ureibacillus chungkukjangi TaxID=1202712 RepID=A0A318TQK5_9BACL|nr:MerR family transcriptional regulator [Ureibacillus chungkukjangi]MCM3388725.1 MerR family transcriptional regulator [Ureibacillus chungkukjangi]PYF06633.1 DNA-binding transcriptional MerR regulator [Ureibacillus chungkukjangi]